jgi:rifampicin phosphotransferase
VSAAAAIPLERAGLPERHGAKAANLARLLNARIRTAPGFVLGVEVLAAHLERLGLARRVETLFASLEAGEAGDDLAEAASIRQRLLESGLDPGLMAALEAGLEPGAAHAVRSSAPGEDGTDASFAGQFDTVLDCRSPDAVARAVRRVWASLFGERALQYARHRRRRPRGMAVLVQRQVEAAVSGVMFTRDPRDPAGNGLLVEYCAGLGESLVSGLVTPGRLVIGRDDGRVSVEQSAEMELAWNPAAPEISGALREVAGRLEALFGTPQDVEWSLDGAGVLHVLQARPITAAAKKATAPAGVVWTNANIAENFPEPVCPLLRSFVGRGYAAYFRDLGMAFGISRKRMEAMAEALDNLVGCHGGRLYYNLSNIHTVLHLAPGGPWLARYFNQFTGAREFTAPKRVEQGRLAQSLKFHGVALRVVWRYLHVQRGLRDFEGEVDAYAAASAPDRLAEKSPAQLAGLLRGFLGIRLERWTGAALADTAAMVCYGMLKALLRGRAGTDANDLLKGLPGLASAMPVERLWDLSRELRREPALSALFSEAPAEGILARLHGGGFPGFQEKLNAYFDTWGFRSSGELMLSRPTPREDPLPLLRLLKSYAALDGAGPAEVSHRQAKARVLATREARRRLGPLRGAVFALVLRAAQGAIRLRERARMKQALLYTRLRHVALALGDALVAADVLDRRDDALFLGMEEAIALGEGTDAGIADVRRRVAERRAELEACLALNPPDSFVLADGESWRAGFAGATDGVSVSTDGLTGTGACGGRACGPAAVVLDVSEIDRIRPDQILVTRQTDPGWAVVFFMIKGLVIERGGLLSHGAIIAREYGIPAVVGVRDATRLIGDGQTLCVDGDRGRVEHVRNRGA